MFLETHPEALRRDLGALWTVMEGQSASPRCLRSGKAINGPGASNDSSKVTGCQICPHSARGHVIHLRRTLYSLAKGAVVGLYALPPCPLREVGIVEIRPVKSHVHYGSTLELWSW